MLFLLHIEATQLNKMAWGGGGEVHIETNWTPAKIKGFNPYPSFRITAWKNVYVQIYIIY